MYVDTDLEDLKRRIVENLNSTKTNASGNTMRSLEVVSNEKGATLYGRKAFGTVETGRKGGKVPKGFYKIIYDWSLSKGLAFNSDSERKTFSYFVAQKIAKEGTSLFKKGGRTDIYSKEIEITIANIQKRIQAEFLTTLTNIKV